MELANGSNHKFLPRLVSQNDVATLRLNGRKKWFGYFCVGGLQLVTVLATELAWQITNSPNPLGKRHIVNCNALYSIEDSARWGVDVHGDFSGKFRLGQIEVKPAIFRFLTIAETRGWQR